MVNPRCSVMPTKLLSAFLAGHAEELDLRLIDFNGGTLRNAIPREAFATIAVAADKSHSETSGEYHQKSRKNDGRERKSGIVRADSVATIKLP